MHHCSNHEGGSVSGIFLTHDDWYPLNHNLHCELWTLINKFFVVVVVEVVFFVFVCLFCFVFAFFLSFFSFKLLV